jgi:hypothetical protein
MEIEETGIPYLTKSCDNDQNGSGHTARPIKTAQY